MADYSDFGHHRVQRLFYRSARNLSVTAVVLSPWLFASAEPWAYLFICLLSAASLGIFLLSKVCFPERHVVGRALTLTLLLLLLLLIVQAMPMPMAVKKIFNPVAAEAVEVQSELFSDMQIGASSLSPLEIKNLHFISSSAPATHGALFLFVGYLGIFIVLANTIRSWKHIEKMTAAIIISSFFLVVLSLSHKFSGTAANKIFWFHMPRYPGKIFGPFTNGHHFAFHLLLLSGLALGLFCSGFASGRKEWATDWREKLAWLDSKHASQKVLLGFALLLFSSAVFISLSRGAVVSLLISFSIMWLLLARIREREGGRVMLWALISMSIALVYWLGWEAVLAQMSTLGEVIQDPLADSRAVMTRDTLLLFKDVPLLGCGFGSFKHVFPIYQGLSLGSGIILHAHNDWAQLFAEGGILGAGVFITAVVLFFRTIMRHFSKAISRARRYVLGLMFGIIAVMIHSFFDYSLHKPANAFLLSALCGLAMASIHMAAIWDSDTDVGGKTHKHVFVRWGLKERLIPLVALILLTIIVTMESASLRRAVAFERFGYAKRFAEELQSSDMLDGTITSMLPEVKLIRDGESVCPKMLHEISANLIHLSLNEEVDVELRLALAEEALKTSALAVSSAPTDYLNWLWLGRVHAVLGNWKHGALCLERAKELRPYGLDIELFEYREAGE